MNYLTLVLQPLNDEAKSLLISPYEGERLVRERARHVSPLQGHGVSPLLLNTISSWR